MREHPAPTIAVRSAGPGDSVALADLLGHLGYPAEPRELPERLARMAEEGGAAVLVATVDGLVVGLATVHSRSVLHSATPVVQLTALVVPPEMRGKGVGRALVAEVERWASALGVRRLVVTTALHRAEAPAFYERLGFEHTGRRYVKSLA